MGPRREGAPDEARPLRTSWTWTTLGQLVDTGGICYGVVQPGKDVPDGVPLVRVSDIEQGSPRGLELKRIDPEIAAQYSRSTLRGNEILLSIVGTIGRTALVSSQMEGWNVARAVAVLPVRPDWRAWVYYWLQSPVAQRFMQSRATTTVQTTLNLRDVREIPIAQPPENDRTRIIDTLSAFDDKVSLNRRMNRSLEALARAIFKSWFVDFDPVRAKMQGCEPVGMNAETAALFPDALVEADGKEMPEGWAPAPIGDVVDCVGGSTPSTKNPRFWEGGSHPFATPKDLSGLASPILLGTDRAVTKEGLAKISSGLLPVDTVLLSSRAPVGYVAIARVPLCVNQGFIAMKPSATLPPSFMIHWLHFHMDEVKSRAGGTTFAEISKRNFRPIPILIPGSEIVQAYDDRTRPLLRRIETNLRESEALRRLRGILLPKLISGAIEPPRQGSSESAA